MPAIVTSTDQTSTEAVINANGTGRKVLGGDAKAPSDAAAADTTPVGEVDTPNDSDEEMAEDENDDKEGAAKSKAAEEKADGDGGKDAGEEEPKKPLAPRGSLASTHNIYRTPKDDDGNFNWTDKEPEDAPEPAENDESAQHAVVVRNIKSGNPAKKFEAASIIVQSPWLRAALAEILRDYTGVACELEKLEFNAPFEPFVHRWPEFCAYLGRREDLDEKTREHLGVLHDVLRREIGDLLRAFEDYMKNGVVTFPHLWMIFQPGGVVLSPLRGPWSAFELEETEYMQNQCGQFLRLRVDCVDTSGKKFGRCREAINVPEFQGVKKITGLNAFPLAFHPQRDGLVASLVERGRVFERLAGHHFKSYSGMAVDWDKEGNEVPTYVTGRIVVDVASFDRWSPYWAPSRHVGSWTPRDLERLAAHRERHAGEENDPERGKLPDYFRMLCRSRTRGYSLKLKKWLDFMVEKISDIEFNTDAFDRLVLPADQKELILAFAESQLDQHEDAAKKEDGVVVVGTAHNGEDEPSVAAADGSAAFDDVIAGKGRGVICLLSGPPGVGKTLTAEAVAESLRVPLHTLSSGDLGSSPWEVESGLSRILELVARWNAILLLDECDVFLEARSTHDLERNKVVSIFLRTLEYYEGILFMTTNRVSNIDPAFQSRIHVSLEYPDLNAESRRTIWRSFLGGGGSGGGRGEVPVVSDEDVAELAELRLNGRQIKNVVKTAQLLARRKKDALRRGYIDTVLAIERRRPAVVVQAGQE